MALTNQEKQTLRTLAAQYAAAAADPAMAETKRLWGKLNDARMERPMVIINQEPWNELAKGTDELNLTVADPFWRRVETNLRRALFRYNHFRVDMVIEPFIPLPMALSIGSFGIKSEDISAATDATNDVKGHLYVNQLVTWEDVEKIVAPAVAHDRAETARRKAEGQELFAGIIPVRMDGYVPMYNIWDTLSTWMSPEAILYDMADRPEFIHAIMKRMCDGYMGILEQMNAQGLYSGCSTHIHCTPTYSSSPAVPRPDDEGVTSRDVWACGMAQIFSTVSPRAHKEFELDYVNPLYERYAAVYYGCCEPLHDRLSLVLSIPHLRKVSCSPWCNVEMTAEALAGKAVVSRKPSPAFLAPDSVNWNAVEADLRGTVDACRRSGASCELILKDVSTVRYDSGRLYEWAERAMRIAKG